MKYSPHLFSFLLLGICIVYTTRSSAQAIDPQKSAKSAADSDTRFITSSISDYEDLIYLSKKALSRGTSQEVKELAQQMVDDHSEMLYTMEQVETAGKGASRRTAEAGNPNSPAAIANARLSMIAASDFDTAWVSSLLTLQQVKYDQLTQAKETVTNPQIKMAITSAMPLIRKHLSKLKSMQKNLTRALILKKKEEMREKQQAR